MSQIQPPNIDEIKRQSVVRFLAEMQELKQSIELEFSSRFDEQKNNFLATSKESYSPQEIGTIFDTIKSLEMEYMKQILTTTSGNGSKVLGNMLSSALTGNLSFSGEATQRIAELEQENTRLKAEIVEKDKLFDDEKSKTQERGEGQIDELNRLQEQVDDQKRTIELYEKQVMEHGETLAQQRIEIEDLQSQVGDESSEKDGLQSLLQEKEELLQENKKIVSNMKEQITSLEKRVQQMKSVSSEKFEAETGRLEETLNMERERADDLEIRVKEASTAIDNYKQALNQKDEEIDKLRKTVTETKSKIASEESDKEAQLRTLADDKKTLEHQITDIKNSLDLTEKKVESLTADLSGKDGVIDNKDKEISDLKKQLAETKDSVSAEKSSQESKMNELLKDKTKHEAEINEFKNEIRDLKKALEDKEKITSEVTKTQEVIEKDRNALQEERDKIMVQFENMKTHLTELESSTAQKDTLIKSLTKSLQSVPKFRVFLAIQDIGGEISIPDLSKIVGQPSDVVEHIVSDLRDDGLVKVAKKENKTFVTKV
ncbi:MAG: ATP-binding protein [Asgard group archaeon]|nr:ATP-binding protein [Asgard group archaeon]